MSNKKQTAVEWLAETLKFSNKEIYAQTYYIIEQAKEMERQQIIDAVNLTIKDIKLDEDKTGFFATNGDWYYKENYEDRD